MTIMAIVNTKLVQFKLMCGVLGFHQISTQHIRKSFQVPGLLPVDWNVSKRFKNTLDRIEFSSEQSLSIATGKISAVRSVHMRQTDTQNAENVLNIAREAKDP